MNQPFNQTTKTFIITHRTLSVLLLVGISILSGILLFVVPPILVLGVVFGILLCSFILVSPFFGLLIYFATFVVQPGALFPALSVLHVERIFGVLVLLSMLLKIKFRKTQLSFVHNPINYILLAFLAVMGLSVFTSFWPTQSVNATIDFAKILVFYFLIVNLLNDQKRLRIFIWEYILLIGWVAVSSLEGYFSGNIQFAQGIERAQGITGSDPNSLAVTLALAAPFIWYILFVEKSRWLKLLSIGVLIASLYTIILTGSRSAILGLVTIVFLVWIRSRRKFVSLIIALLIVTITWIVMPEQYKGRYKTILSSTHGEIDDSSQGRINAWKAGMEMFFDRPFLGVGVGAFGTAHATSYTPEGKPRSWLKAHNTYVQLLAELGILGTIIFVILIYNIIRQNIKVEKKILSQIKVKDWNYYLSIAMMTSLGCLFVTGIFGHSLYRFNWYLIAALTVVLVRLSTEIIEQRGS
ncbi:MAG: O-antigen ligase family protein [candidate division Zixibacteria bacterium]|nr:O-antigen ligase family protein [candidate division Zixibacteria bacterium]